jgi:hypothetical protein
MNATIHLPIVCGATTCASEPGKFCQLLRWTLNGKASCHIFGQLHDADGWVQRAPECIAAAVPTEPPTRGAVDEQLAATARAHGCYGSCPRERIRRRRFRN